VIGSGRKKMTEGELNKKVEFIIEQQAQFAADIEVMREVQREDAKQLRNLSDAVITVVGLVGGLAESQQRTDARVAELAEAQTRTDASLKELAEAQARTDERLNIFINVVEKYISGNGNKGSQDRA
jgi:hypothetical protein